MSDMKEAYSLLPRESLIARLNNYDAAKTYPADLVEHFITLYEIQASRHSIADAIKAIRGGEVMSDQPEQVRLVELLRIPKSDQSTGRG